MTDAFLWVLDRLPVYGQHDGAIVLCLFLAVGLVPAARLLFWGDDDYHWPGLLRKYGYTTKREPVPDRRDWWDMVDRISDDIAAGKEGVEIPKYLESRRWAIEQRVTRLREYEQKLLATRDAYLWTVPVERKHVY